MALTKVTSGIRTLATDEVTTDIIEDGTVTNAKIKSDAAIEASKLESTLDLSGKTVTLPAASVTAHVTQFDDNQLKEEIALLGFRTAVNGSLAKYDLVDQTIDVFEDATGIDAGSSTDETRDSAGKYYSGTTPGNYFGDESDGTLSTSGNVTYTVPNTQGIYDGDMYVAIYTSLTINAGHTITTDHRGRGLLIYVAGDCVINGTLSMDLKGAAANPGDTASWGAAGSDGAVTNANGIQLGLITAGGTETLPAATFAGSGTSAVTAVANQPAISSNGTIFGLARIGGAGGATKVDTGGYSGGNFGTAGFSSPTTHGAGTGGGGGGGASFGTGGAGGNGTCWSGGSGGGAGQGGYGGPYGTGGAGDNYGGAGGSAQSAGSAGGGTPGRGAAGGAGNPGANGSYYADTGPAGTGGVVYLVVKGNLSGSGVITADGNIGGKGCASGYTEHVQASSGATGGGAIFCLVGGADTFSGTRVADGPLGGQSPASSLGGNGGDGSTVNAIISAVDFYDDMTLISNATTAEATPTKGDLVMTYSNGAGTATINTDLKAYASRDDGTTWTQLTLASQGSTGAHTILSAHDLDISGQPSGTDMRYKIETLNQSVTKQTRIHAVSLGWS